MAVSSSAPVRSSEPARSRPAAGSSIAGGAAAPLFPWLVIGIGFLLLLVQALHSIAEPALSGVFHDPIIRLATLAVVLLGVAICVLCWYRVIFPGMVLQAVMVFTVLAAFTLSLIEASAATAAVRPLVGLSRVALWIAFAGVLIPYRPGWSLAMLLSAASMWPLALAVARGRAEVAFALPGVSVWLGFNYLIAGVAWLISRQRSGGSSKRGASDLGSYHLLARIGEGGMGEVWKASHQMLARRAAVKLVRPVESGSFSRNADMWIERFRREANVIAGLQSPHTIYLYDFGISHDGQFYYVMELLDGVSLQTLITTFGPQPAPRIRAILLQICESLEEAHLKGLIHRDLKPSNVMICKLALKHDFVKVLDFGLAKCAACEDVSALTLEGTATGTPGYIAPEIALGETTVDGRADIYALGCVAYFLLTGTLVFPDSNPMSMAVKHVQATPDPPSSRTEIPIPDALERLVLRCLEKKPADRPASTREVADALHAVDLPPWSEDEASLWWERHLPPSSSLRTVAAVETGARR